jgi:hypothetical protein
LFDEYGISLSRASSCFLFKHLTSVSPCKIIFSIQFSIQLIEKISFPIAFSYFYFYILLWDAARFLDPASASKRIHNAQSSLTA